MDDAIQINVLVSNPTCGGTIKSITPYIQDWPNINPNFVNTEEDKLNSQRVVNKCHKYYTHESLIRWARTSDSQLECGAAFIFPIRTQSQNIKSLYIWRNNIWSNS